MTKRVQARLPIDVGLKTFLEEDPPGSPPRDIADLLNYISSIGVRTLDPLLTDQIEADRSPPLAFLWGTGASRQLRQFGEWLEKTYPGLRPATINTPVMVLPVSELPVHGLPGLEHLRPEHKVMGLYGPANVKNPHGIIFLPGKNPEEKLFGPFAHEGVHRFFDFSPVGDRWTRHFLLKVMSGKQPGKPVVDRLSLLLGQPMELDPEEVFAQLFGHKYSPMLRIDDLDPSQIKYLLHPFERLLQDRRIVDRGYRYQEYNRPK